MRPMEHLARGIVLPLLLGGGMLQGCVHHAPQPLRLERNLQELEARRLTDPIVLRQVRSKLGTGRSAAADGGWGRAELLVAALEFNPALGEARAKLQQAAAGLANARALPNPTLSLASEYDLARASEPSWLWGVGSSFLLDGVVGRPVRIDLAQAELRGARADFADALWSVRREVRASVLAVVMAQRRVALLEPATQHWETLRRMAATRIETGESPRSDELQAEVELARSRAALEDARRGLAEGRSRLAAALGVGAPALEAVKVEWNDVEELPAVTDEMLADTRGRALLSRSDLARAIADYDARELELKQQTRAQYLQISLGPGYTYDHGVRKLTLGASIGLPVFNHNQGPIAQALAARETAGLHVLATQAGILHEIDAAAAAYALAVAAREKIRAQRLASESLASAAGRAFTAGAIDHPTRLGAEVSLNVERLAELDALDRAQQALGQLEDALRTPLSGPEVSLP